MSPNTPSYSLPLPRGWPRRVRSAVVQVISLARTSLALTQGWASESLNPELRQRAVGDRQQQEIQLLREEIRIKDARMEQIEAHRRPHYPPTHRLAILELRAARGWTLAQTARIFLVSPLTIASWMGRLEEEGPDALVRLPEPVNKFPDFVAYLVKRLRVLCPTLGSPKSSPARVFTLGRRRSAECSAIPGGPNRGRLFSLRLVSSPPGAPISSGTST
jgi:transposase-like protein